MGTVDEFVGSSVISIILGTLHHSEMFYVLTNKAYISNYYTKE
jgi:hypothetical protein